MKRLVLAAACVFVGGMVTAVKVTNAVLDRLDEAERGEQIVLRRVPS